MAFNEKELDIIKVGIQNGKTQEEVEKALLNYRSGIIPQKENEERASIWERLQGGVGEAVDRVGNVAGELADKFAEEPTKVGKVVTATQLPLKVGGELSRIAGETLMKPVMGASEALGEKIMEKFPDVTAPEEAFSKVMQNIGGVLQSIKGTVGEDVYNSLADSAELLSWGIGGKAAKGGVETVGKSIEIPKIPIPNMENALTSIKTATPKLLSYTSDVPDKAFEQLLKNRVPVNEAIRAGVTAEEALSDTQAAVRGLRKTMTQEWQDALPKIADEFSGKRFGLGDSQIKKLNTLIDEFGLDEDLIPQNLKSMSAIEAMNLQKAVNEINKGQIALSPKGVVVRQFKDELKTSILSNFGGEKGSVGNLWQNYSVKKGVFDAANDLVRAYQVGKPISQSTALGRLKALFNENKSAYLDAILELEKTTGKDLMSKITAVQFGDKLPKKLSSVSASGGLQSPKGLIDKALDLLILPLSSPRSAAYIATKIDELKLPTNTIPQSTKNSNIFQPLQDLKKKIDETPNKQGGFVKNPLASDDLLSRAKKFDTEEEFVKKQPIVYHGSPTELKQFSNKQGTFFTDDYMNADGYGSGENIYEGYLNLKNPLIIDAKGKLHRELDTPYGKTTREIVANVDQKKYDGVIFKNIKDSWIDDADVDTPSTIYFAFKPKDAFLNESQLSEIWKKAHNK